MRRTRCFLLAFCTDRFLFAMGDLPRSGPLNVSYPVRPARVEGVRRVGRMERHDSSGDVPCSCGWRRRSKLTFATAALGGPPQGIAGRNPGSHSRVVGVWRPLGAALAPSKVRCDLMTSWWQDLRYAGRRLRSSPGFTLTVLATLAIGIGANTAIYTVVQAVLLRPLPYTHADRLVALFTIERQGTERRNPTAPANFLDWQRQNRSFQTMAAAYPWSPTLRSQDTPDQLSGLVVSPNLFDLLGASARLGRALVPADGEAGAERVVVLGDGLWRRRFGADPGIVGRSILLDGEAYTVVGVMANNFQFPPFWATDAELWVPLRLSPEQRADRAASFLRVFARLRPGVTLADARADMTLIARRLAEAYPRTNRDDGVNVETLREPVVSEARPALLVLMGAVTLVLLIACTNVAGLMLGRVAAREREAAIRLALGSSRAGLLRLWLADSLLLAAMGGALGLGLAVGGTRLLTVLAGNRLPRIQEIQLDGGVLAFTVAVSVTVGLLLALAPGLRVIRLDPAGSLRTRPPYQSLPPALRQLLVGAQLALALTLLAGAGLLGRSFLGLQHRDPGFRTNHLLTLTLPLAGSAHAAADRQVPFLDAVLQEVRSIPGVVTAAFINHLPIGGDVWRSHIAVQGQPALAEGPTVAFRVVSPGYLRTMGIPLIRGRDFSPEDRATTTAVAVINRTMARALWPGGDALGRRFKLGRADSDAPWITVVGISADVRQVSLTEPTFSEVYLPYTQNPVAWYTTATLVVHTRGVPLALVPLVKQRIWALDGSVPVTRARSMEQILSHDLAPERLDSVLLGFFAVAAFLLAMVGLYGMVSYLITLRSGEIGIRLALGALPGDITRMVVRQGLQVTLWATAAGLGGALLLTRFLRSLLYDIGTRDPLTLALATAMLVGVTVVSSWLPARRAGRLDPVATLRG